MLITEFVIVVGMAVVTFVIRYLLFAVHDRISFPPIINRSLKFIPPAVLTAITLPIIFMPEDKLDFTLSNPYLFASFVAVVAGIVSKNLLITILFGLGGFFIFNWLVL
jgi:branched-subunit amino acid transport protein